MKKRVLAILCAAVLLLGLLAQAGAAGEWDENVIFLAVNDRPVPLSDSTMPILVGGTVYVPYGTFDANQNGGIRLGVFNGGQNKTEGTLTLYNSSAKNLTFDLRTGTSYDYYPDGEKQQPTAVIRSGQIYLSARSTANYFGLQYMQDNLTFGDRSYPLVRIYNSSATLSDSTFKSSANITYTYFTQLQNYYRSKVSQPEESGGTQTATPTGPSTVPTDSVGSRSGVQVYLAFRCETGQAGTAILDTLRSRDRGGLFLFSVEQLKTQDDLVRRALGEGHIVGLITGADTLEGAEQELEEGNRLLAYIARTSTHIVLAENRKVAQALKDKGWLCWKEDIDGLPQGRGSAAVSAAVLGELEEEESEAWIMLDDSPTSSLVLSNLLQTLQTDGYTCRLPVETEF